MRRAASVSGPAGGDPVDAIVVGSGPNGLAAAITLARAGRSVRVYEAAPTAGGGTRTAELTLPGFRHDVCSTILPLTLASPFFASIDLRARGVELVHPGCAGGPPAGRRPGRRAASVRWRPPRTAWMRPTGVPGTRLFGPLVRDVEKLGQEILQPVVHLPRHPLALARFGLPALRSARGLARARFRDDAGAGPVRRGCRPFDAPPRSPAERLVRTRPRDLCPGRRLAHGSRRRRARSAAALVAELEAAGGEIVTGQRVASLDELPPARAVLLDVTPRQLVAIAGDRLSPGDAAARRALPLRLGRVQGGLGPRRSGPVDRRRTASRCDGPPRRDAGRDRRRRGRRRRRPPPGAPVHPLRPVHAVGYVAGAGGQDHGLGVLPRPGRVDGRHDRPDRGAGRALRAGLSRPDPGPRDAWAGRRWRRTTRTTSAATSTAASRTSASWSSVRGRPSIRIASGEGSISVRRQHRPAAASTACAASLAARSSLRHELR